LLTVYIILHITCFVQFSTICLFKGSGIYLSAMSHSIHFHSYSPHSGFLDPSLCARHCWTHSWWLHAACLHCETATTDR